MGLETEKEAMQWAAEASLLEECRREKIAVARHEESASRLIAEYVDGVEQLETLALDSIILECSIFAEFKRRSETHPLVLLTCIAGAVVVWYYGVDWLAKQISGGFGLIASFVIGTAIVGGIAWFIARGVSQEHRQNHDESVKWAREVVHRVLKRDPVLRGRILSTRARIQPRRWSESMGDKFEDEIKRLERAGFG